MPLSNDDPVVEGSAYAGQSANAARGDHVHPVAFPDCRILVSRILTEFWTNGDAGSSLTLTTDRLAMWPISFTASTTIDFDFELNATATGDLKWGLWGNESATYHLPSELLFSETVTITSESANTWISGSGTGWVVTAGTPYWLGVQNNIGSGVSLRAGLTQHHPPIYASGAVDVAYGLDLTSRTGALGNEDLTGGISYPRHDKVPRFRILETDTA